MTVVIFTTVLIVAAVLIAVIALRANQSRSQDPLPRRMFAMETAEEIAPPENQPGFPAVHPELPDSYDDTRLVLMVRDPQWLYAYWEVGDGHLENLRHHHGEAINRDNMTLRVFEISDQMQYFDINVGGLARDWHFRIGKSQTPFYCQLGLKYHQEFIPLAVSNTVVTPRDTLSNLFDEDWMLVTEHEQRLLKRMGEFPLDLTSPFRFRKEG
jgi:hypothetical protein